MRMKSDCYWISDSTADSSFCEFFNSNVISGGSSNSAYSSFSFIGGGAGNTVSGLYSSIVGGAGSTVSGAYSAVLGGAYNTISAAYQYAGIFGCNIAAVASNAFHTNCLIACSTPQYASTPFPVGTIFTCTNGIPVPTLHACPLYVWM